MKNLNIKYFAVSLILIIIAWLSYGPLYKIAAEMFFGERLDLTQVESFPHHLSPKIFFLLAIGIIPLLILFIKNFRGITSLRKIRIVGLTIITSGLVFLSFRIFYLRFLVADLADQMRRAELALGAEFDSVKLEDLHLEIFLFAGIIFGALLSLFIFRKKKN